MRMATKARRMKRIYRVEPAIAASRSFRVFSFFVCCVRARPRDVVLSGSWQIGLLIAAAVRRRNDADPNTATNKTLADEGVTVDSGEKK